MDIKILGTGCVNCNNLEANARTVMAALGVNVEIDRVSDSGEIVSWGGHVDPGAGDRRRGRPVRASAARRPDQATPVEPMNRLDCARVGDIAAALAVSADCGPGICGDHLVEAARVLTRSAAIDRQVPVDPPARVLRCRIWAAARDAQHRLGSVISGVG